MTLQELRNSVLARMGADHEIDNTQIDQFINEGYHRVIGAILDNNSDYFGGSETFNITANTTEYTPTSEFLNVRGVEVDYNDGLGWRKAKPAQFDDIKAPSNNDTSYFSKTQPYYYMWGTKIVLLPESSTTEGTFIVRGTIMPTDLSTNSDEPAFPSVYHDLLTTWAHACMVESVDENYLDGQRKREEFENGIEMLLRVIGARQSDGMRKVRITNLY